MKQFRKQEVTAEITALELLEKQAKKFAQEALQEGNFISWTDLDDNYALFKLDGKCGTHETEKYTFNHYESSKVVLFAEGAKPIKVLGRSEEGEMPRVPLSTRVREKIEEAIKCGHTVAYIGQHVLVPAGTSSKGKSWNKFHKVAFDSCNDQGLYAVALQEVK